MASLDHLKLFRRLYNIRRTCLRTYSRESSTGSSGSSDETHQPPASSPPTSGGGRKIPLSKQDPLPIFLQRKVQEVLLKISRLSMEDAVRIRKTDHHRKPRYELMSEVELKRMEVSAMERAIQMLKMPPYMKAKDQSTKVLCHDPEISPALTSKWMFTDISGGEGKRDRVVVVRDTDGTLRTANPEERTRANHIYYPREGVSAGIPKMFEKDHLAHLLENGLTDIIYILDRACVQFEPDDPDFIRVTQTIYDYVLQNRCFNKLASTRFFGPMSFYFILRKNIKYLLVDMIQHDLLLDAVSLIHLFENIHKNKKIPVPQDISTDTEDLLNLIEKYCDTYSEQKLQDLKEAVKSYRQALTDEASSQAFGN
ncbi:28S ribosomal protein S22, mitochondrial-like [Pecten maximus]|uniref:28S ribosomal protein S22, mitochondrial-like n=1 Tax=Pecten maximus TaxID=6579 RepID=UPI001458813F|nr:28S ribosomal protein S22, mitochondrial-like [Pecten maximus]